MTNNTATVLDRPADGTYYVYVESFDQDPSGGSSTAYFFANGTAPSYILLGPGNTNCGIDTSALPVDRESSQKVYEPNVDPDCNEAAITVPFIHIADATAQEICKHGLKRPAMMATAYTMEQDFYVGRLRDRFGLDVIVPEEADRRETHRIIYDELCKGIVTEQSRKSYEAIAERLKQRGADCLILGCTEVAMLLNAGNVSMPVFDTAVIHANAAANFALAGYHLKAAE